MSQIYDILSGFGYRLRDEGRAYRTSALYRGGSNRSCMVVFKDTGAWKDFKTNKTGSFRELLLLHVNPTEADRLLADFDPNGFSYKAQQVEIPKKLIYDREVLKKLLPIWDLYIEDGISQETMQEFEVGYKESDHLFYRYCFPIYNEHGGIIGFAGRHKDKVVPEGTAKWKLHGKKKEWLWPLHINAFDIDAAEEVILIESPNDGFHLWEAGVKNFLCMFGVEMSPKVFNYLVKNRPKRIIIATHNDKAENEEAGQAAAKKIKNTLSMFFSEERLIVALPTRKDFGEMSKEEILNWKQKVYEQIESGNTGSEIYL